MTHTEVVRLQNALNRFTRKFKGLDLSDLMADGDLGVHTKNRIRDVKWFLGYKRSNLTHVVNDNFYFRIDNPYTVAHKRGQYATNIKWGRKRRLHRHQWVVHNRVRAYLKPGVGTFDGVPVAKCAIPVMRWCRDNGWKGRLVSGYRTPEYSEHLCKVMCGRPTCPGKCAGRNTNHAYKGPDRFAIDVSDYYNFGSVVARCPVKPRIHNSLPQDRVHFSPQGN